MGLEGGPAPLLTPDLPEGGREVQEAQETGSRPDAQVGSEQAPG